MSINVETVAEKTFNILKGFGYEVRSFDKDGNQVINPKEATRFAVAEPNLLARLDVKEKAILLATSQDLSESPVRDMLKELAQDYLLTFDYKIFDKKIKPKGEKIDIRRNAETDMADVMEEINTIRKLAGLEEKYQYANTEEKLQDMIDTHQYIIDNNHPEEVNVQDHEDAIGWYEGLLDIHKKTGQDKFEAPQGGDTAWREMIWQEMEDIDLYKPHGQGDLRGVDNLPEDAEMAEMRKLSGLEPVGENTKDPESKGDCEPCKGTGYKDGDMKSNKSCKVCDGDGEDPGFGGTKAYEEKEKVAEASLGKMTGSRKSSYQPLADSVKIIVRHNKDVNEEVRGARSRNIHSILIQRGEEKFKMAENNLQAARAMARHLHNGGETFDTVGQAITEMAQDYSKLREFVRYVRKAKLVNETNEEFVSLAVENINDIKTNFKRLSGVKSYANAVETVTNYNNVELLQDDLDLESKFTETHFDDKVASVMDNLKVMASKKHAFENYIIKAIESEKFENIKEQLKEDELLEFDTPHAKLGHQVSKLGYSAKDETLGNYLHSISGKLNAGGTLNPFEYRAIKSSLLSAGQHNVSNAPTTMEESYEAFLDQFII